ncbi:TolC family protein [Pedobacter helvus]|uniref:TolC family protein n=1 Tax=Pedobacter helvus TaxID=2563444 RepID=A0ABW9JJ91_9SPHI|nr:efflux transporter outer membrane subunit [Pedobacter ureilyticus]
MTNYNHKYIFWVGAFATAFGVSCSTLKYEQPNAVIPDTFRHGTNDSTAYLTKDMITNKSIANIQYKEFFSDPILIDLIDKGIANNNDLKVAVRQIDIASMAYSQTKWNNVPTANLTLGAASVNRPSDNSLNGMTVGQFLGQKYIADYSTTLSLSWEVDIWGKIKARKEGALAVFLQTQEAAKAVQTRLVSEIARGYYNLLMLDLQIDVTEQNLKLVERTLNMIKVQQGVGLTTSLAVQQQETARDQILATLPALKQTVVAQENILHILVGEVPGPVKRSGSLLGIKEPGYLAVGIPAELLANRPDVKSEELAIRQAFASVKVAKRSLYPSLNITAQGGLNSFEANQWFKVPGSLFGTAMGSLAQPLLNGKRLKTQFKQSEIMLEQSELKFKQTVLNALGEVSNYLTSIEALQKQELITNGLVKRAEESVKTANVMFSNDLATYLDVIVAQNNKLQAELSIANIRKQKLSAYVDLYRSLGGGWQ